MKKIIITFFLLIVGTAYCFAGEPVQIAVDQSNPPFMYESGGKAAGLYPELMSTVFQKMGIPVDIHALPWKRALNEADSGKMGIAGIYKTDERSKKYDYSQEIFKEKLMLFVSEKKKFPYQNINDLKGKSIGIILGWSYGDEFDAALKAGLFKGDTTNNDDTNFKKLMTDRIDCLLAIEESGKSNSEKNYQGKAIGLNPPVAINPTYLIFGKNANQTELLSKFNATLKVMMENGSYEEFIRSFFARQ